MITPEFKGWRTEYYDVAVLGATHWRQNMAGPPSHLNPNLKADPKVNYPRGDILSPIPPNLAGARKTK